MTTVNLKAFVQGYYTGNGQMTSVRLNQDGTSPANEVETITVRLHNQSGVVETQFATLQTDGTATAEFTSEGNYFISVKGRNSLQTFTASELSLNGTTVTYDFSTSASAAYGDNQIEVESGVFAFYSGDVTGNGSIGEIDQTQIETAIANSAYGVCVEDLNGDGAVDNQDLDIFWANVGKQVCAPVL